ncbi:hypothetical protein BC936DRAFT_137037 [Jimgerdemannia flammicorona]|uniref:Uncharacterized protein n=1 Tax=Jimgerdemannia flammicorona TaxID=994334 RepID=A0A433CY77_9FUNG|nr:hypothetical protein BC936DRAFT_137037 [Jimgerdemannia flammicorona]
MQPALASFLLLWCSISIVSAQTTNNTFNYLQDRFPDKVYLDPEGSTFIVDYYKWYKVVTDRRNGNKYALVCCNQSIHLNQTQNFAGVFSLPIGSIVVMDTASIAFIEVGSCGLCPIKYWPIFYANFYRRDALVGDADRTLPLSLQLLEGSSLIKAAGSPNNITSNCVYNNLEAAKSLTPFNISKPNATQPFDVVFSTKALNDSKVVPIGLSDQLKPLQKAEWILFFGVFLDQENLAKNILFNIQNQYNCHRNNLANVGKKLLAWVNYDPISSAWNIDTDVYHNQLLIDAGATPLNPGASSIFTNISAFHQIMNQVQLVIDTTLFSTQQSSFYYWQVDAAYFPGQDPYNETFLTQKRVWRTDGLLNNAGFDDWSERSAARPDLALQDIIAIQYPTYQPNYQLTWFRNFARGDSSQHTEDISTDCTSASTIFGNWACSINPYTDPSTTFSISGIQSGSGSATADNASGLSPGAAAAIGLGASLGVAAVALVSYFGWRKHQSDPNHSFVRMEDM